MIEKQKLGFVRFWWWHNYLLLDYLAFRLFTAACFKKPKEAILWT